MNGVQESETGRNTVSKSVNGVSTTYSYNNFNQQTSVTSDGKTAQYAYNTQGIRTVKAVDGSVTKFYLDGGNVVGETTGTQTVSYLRGLNLIHNGSSYYLFNAHADVVNLTNSSGSVTKTYSYDAFGVEKNPSETDTNRFRYCGEYWDAETETYYLRARYYNPALGRFTQQDTHWNTANMIYGDNPQKINAREDRLGLKSYSFAPQISAVLQSGNLYVYCGSNPIYYTDNNGCLFILGALGIAVLALTLTSCSASTNSWDDTVADDERYMYEGGGYYTDIDECINHAIETITEDGRNVTNDFGKWVESGMFILREKDGLQRYLHTTAYNSGSVDSIDVDLSKYWNTYDIIGFIHTHPHDGNTIIWNTYETSHMVDGILNMVVAYQGIDKSKSTVYYCDNRRNSHVWTGQTYAEMGY